MMVQSGQEGEALVTTNVLPAAFANAGGDVFDCVREQLQDAGQLPALNWKPQVPEEPNGDLYADLGRFWQLSFRGQVDMTIGLGKMWIAGIHIRASMTMSDREHALRSCPYALLWELETAADELRLALRLPARPKAP